MRALLPNTLAPESQSEILRKLMTGPRLHHPYALQQILGPTFDPHRGMGLVEVRSGSDGGSGYGAVVRGWGVYGVPAGRGGERVPWEAPL